MELIFRKFNPQVQQNQHRALFSECFPEVYYKEGYAANYENNFRHLYQSFPSSPPSYQYAAMLGEELVGFYSALPFKYKIGNKIVQAGMIGGVMTSPKHRKLGIFTKLGNFAAESQRNAGVDFNLTFPIRKAVMPGFMRMGWDIVFEMPLYIRFLKLNSLLKSKKLSLLAPILNPFLSAYNFVSKKRDNHGIRIGVFDQFKKLEGYEEFINSYNSKISNTLIKDTSFCNWRYGSPSANYLFFCAYKDNHLIGFVSARHINREGVPSYGILDFMSINDDCLSNLHNALAKHAKSNKMEAIMMMMSKTSAKNYSLFPNGFLKSPYKFHLIIKTLSDKLTNDELFKENSWHLMFVDSDDL